MFLERYLYKVFRIHVLPRSRTKFTAVFRVGSGILEIDFFGREGRKRRRDTVANPIEAVLGMAGVLGLLARSEREREGVGKWEGSFACPLFWP